MSALYCYKPLTCQLVLTNPDGPLPLAKRPLSDCVHALADPIPEWTGGACRWADPLYRRLREALSVRPTGRGAAQRSRPPCSVTTLALLLEIDDAAAAWTPDEKGGTVERLHALTAKAWRPPDAAMLDRHCDDLARWAVAATGLLDPVPLVYLRQPCPRCGARFAHRRDGAGELVNVRALRVSENGCMCSGCGAFWGPERFHFLAALLGCEPLPA